MARIVSTDNNRSKDCCCRVTKTIRVGGALIQSSALPTFFRKMKELKQNTAVEVLIGPTPFDITTWTDVFLIKADGTAYNIKSGTYARTWTMVWIGNSYRMYKFYLLASDTNILGGLNITLPNSTAAPTDKQYNQFFDFWVVPNIPIQAEVVNAVNSKTITQTG